MKPLLLALTLGTALPAVAQTEVRRAQVYRCGADGRDLRDSPCPNGSAAGSNVDYDQPSASDSRAARERHLAEAKQAAALSQARRASEAEGRRQRSQAVGLQALPPAAQAASGPLVTTIKPPKTVKPKKPGDSGR
ncbi:MULTISPECIES: hypothetical protein [unclassified Roseateles]|uniref:hypothetical protein n=1 Tax=unclassified Roseateles TaxID=2626991 RepID=UPI0006FAFC8D|nr:MULTISPECIES: hypothetical protein [unclassified Roseateles]KQW42880.1 hypothetical protein ASC81_19715 [Pelomonas sp. Root405]KRA69558.1 hypothetical protein ASD88_20365 [Pelomonas sp. Root662]